MSGIVVVGPLVVDVGTVAEDVGGGIVKVKVAVVASVVVVVPGRVVVGASVVDNDVIVEDVETVVVEVTVDVPSVVVVVSDRVVFAASVF